MELRLFRHYADHGLNKEFESFAAMLLPNRILSLLPDILALNMEAPYLLYIVDRLGSAEHMEKAAEALVAIEDQSILVYFLRDDESISKSAYLLTLKAKTLCLDNDSLEILSNFVATHFSKINMEELRLFGESKNPNLMLKLYYKLERFDELLKISFKLSSFSDVARYLIVHKDAVLWKKALIMDDSKELFQCVTSWREYF